MKKKITALDVKQALLDQRFRENLPEQLLPDVQKFMSNPGCSCNHPIYRKVLKEAAQSLAAYFPTKDLIEPEELPNEVPDWTVISCSIDELANRLRKLPKPVTIQGVARWENQITVIIKEV